MRASLGCSPESRWLVELRDRWLNQPEWVESVDATRPPQADADEPLQRWPAVAADGHAALDAAAAATYGSPADISNEDVSRELLALNGGDP